MHGTKIWGGDLKNSHQKTLWEGHEDTYDVSCQSVFSTTYCILLAKFGENSIELYALKLIMGFQQWLAHLSPSWLVNKATSLSRHLVEQGFSTWHKFLIMWRYHGVYLIGKPMTTQLHQQQVMMISRRSFLLKSGTLSKLVYLHIDQGFLKYKCELYLKQPLTPPQRKTIVAYHTSNPRLAIEIGWWMTIPISRLRHFCSYNAVEDEAQFVLECPLYNPIIYKFPSLF